jgi:hypothetical protein
MMWVNGSLHETKSRWYSKVEKRKNRKREMFPLKNNLKGGYDLHQGPVKLQIITAFNQKFLPGGPGGAVFSKRVPPGRRRRFKLQFRTFGGFLISISGEK